MLLARHGEMQKRAAAGRQTHRHHSPLGVAQLD
jgi:hypothetical protein